MAPHLRAVTVQTPVAARRVRDRYGLDESRIHVVPSACTIKPLGMLNPDQAPKILRNVDAVRFLFLAQFYPHKNHEILIPVLRELREQGFERRVHFFLTITPEHPAARDLLSRLNDFDSMVTNLGPIPAQAVQHHLAACHALFLPTLLETFGLVYLEAMSTGTAILTSDRDFSRYVCGDYAEFFEPTDPAGVVRSIVKFVAQQPKAGSLASKGAEWLAGKFITWDDVAARYLAMLESCAEIDGPNGVA